MLNTRKKPIVVGLLWHSLTSNNLGVGALTFGQMALISEAARKRGVDVRFAVVGTRGGTPYPVEGYELAGSGEFALRAFKSGNFNALKLLMSSDIVFDIGEGDSFADIYGSKRLFIQVLAKAIARLAGKTIILSPQTIGPFKSWFGKRLGRFAMNISKRIYARDNLSMNLLRELGMGSKSREVIDVAFALPFARSEKTQAKPKIGINVSGLLFNRGYHGKNEFGLTVDYPVFVERVCSELIAANEYDVYLVPHVISDDILAEDDLRASQSLVQKIPGLKLAPRFGSPIEAKSFIAGLDFFSGARMHACIAAFSSGVPVIPMAYSRKFNGLFSSLNYEFVTDGLVASTDDAYAQFFDALRRRHELTAAVERGNAMARTKLASYVDDLAALLPVTDKVGA